jgi:phosphoribosylformylglycinamidine synthase
MASDEFEEGKAAVRTVMQVGDPFMEKLLLEACLELFEMDVLEGIQDMGAAGLTSSSTEMAARAGNGLELDLDLVPRRAKGMLPYEILLSESQERMLLVAQKGKEQRVLDVCKKWDIDAAVIGRVTDTKRWVVKATPGFDPLSGNKPKGEAVVVCDIPVHAVADDAPVYDRPRKPWSGPAVATDIPKIAHTKEALQKEFLEACGSPNLGSRQWVWHQYDHVVRGGTIVGPGSDAAVVRVPCGDRMKYLAFASDCNARMCEVDPFAGGAMAVAECCRNLVCSGAEPVGLTDCLNFGNPERPEIMEQFARAIEGIAAACNALAVPIVSGNVSLYNETSADGKPRAILPTPTIAGVGLLRDEKDVVTAKFKKAGDVVLLLGELPVLMPKDLPRALAGSEWLSRKTGRIAGGTIAIDLDLEARLQKLVLGLAREHRLASAHDVSDGGLAMCLAECCETLGAKIHIGGPVETWAGTMFGEQPSRIVISVSPDHEKAVTDAARASNIEVSRLGTVDTGPLRIDGTVPCEVPLDAIRTARDGCLDAIVVT